MEMMMAAQTPAKRTAGLTAHREQLFHHGVAAHRVKAAKQLERERRVLPLGFDLLSCARLLLLRPGVNCPTLGSISNRTARDMGPDTSKWQHYIIPPCSGK